MHIRPWVPHGTGSPIVEIPTSGITDSVSRLQLAPGRIFGATVQGFTTDGRVHLFTGDVSFCAVPRGITLSAGMTVSLAVAQVEPDIVLRVLPDWVMNPHAAAPPREAGKSGPPGGEGLERWAAFARRYLQAAEGRITTQAEHVEFIRAALALQEMVRPSPRKARGDTPARTHGSLDFLQDDLLRILDDRIGTRRGSSTHQAFVLDGGKPETMTARVHVFRTAGGNTAGAEPRLYSVLLTVRTRTLGKVQALLAGDDSGGNISFQVDSGNVRVRFMEHFGMLRDIIPRWNISGIACNVHDPEDRARAIRHAVAALAAVRPVDMRL